MIHYPGQKAARPLSFFCSAGPLRSICTEASQVRAIKILRDNPGIVIFPLLFLAAALVILPDWNHPFNDDWSYACITRTFCETGTITFINWGEPTLISHVLWGALFCKLLGFSFTALQLSVLFWAITGAIVFYLMLKYFAVPESRALAGTLLLVSNPIYFINSFTFMTDVAFLGALLLAVYLYLLHHRSGKVGWLLLCGLVSTGAFMNRQHAIVLPFVFALHALAGSTSRGKSSQVLIWCFSLPLLADGGVLIWRYLQPDIYTSPLLATSLIKFASRLLRMIVYIGMFTLPITVPTILNRTAFKMTGLKRHPQFLIVLAPALLMGVLAAPEKMMPLLGNNITVYGMFSINDIVPGKRSFLFPPAFWWAITLLSVISAAQFLLLIVDAFLTQFNSGKGLAQRWSAILKRFREPVSVVYLASFGLFLLPLVHGLIIDRYLLMFLPGCILFLSRCRLPWTKTILALMVLGFLLFSAVMIYDTVGWNRVRWQSAERLVRSGISPRSIDAGFEWCGWYADKPVGRPKPLAEPGYFVSKYILRFFPGIDNQYCIAFSERRGFHVMEKIRYPTVFWKKEPYIYILQRN